SLLTDSQTVDEGPHILAGYSYLKTGKILLNPEHPPLLKAWSALPLLILNPDLPEEVKKAAKIPAELDQWGLSYEFLHKNRVPADTMIFWSRLMMVFLTTFGALGIALIARKWFGDLAGIVAFILFAFDPNVLAHGRLVTTDTGSAIFIFFAAYAFYLFLKKPTALLAIGSGGIFALALAAKFSSLTLIPVFLILFAIKIINEKNDFEKYLKLIPLFILAAFIALWAIYGFNIEKPINDPKVLDLYRRREILAADPNTYHADKKGDYKLARWIIRNFDPQDQPGTIFRWLAEEVPVPAYRYFRGFFEFLAHDYRGHYTYLSGHIYETGMWQYFIIAYLIKSPLPLLILLAFSFCVFAVFRMRKHSFSFIGYVLLIPPIIYWLISLKSHINIGIRHLMPIYPFYAVMIAGAIALIIKKTPEHSPFFQKSILINSSRKQSVFFKIVFVILIIWFLAETAMIYPYHLSYFNELIGGPKNGHQYLLDSNIDWGQDFLRLKKYMKDNNLDSVYLRYFGKTDWDYYGVKGYAVPNTKEVLKNGPPNGVVIINLTPLFLFNTQEFSWLLNYTPTDRIGHSMRVYDFRK
ncbi:MAG: glycosyltransferase family 39 protein, partial [Patescibacteria group bacterium]